MRFLKYLSYTFVFLISMVGSAYGAITLSMNNSANQQSFMPNTGGSAQQELPKQITSIVENLTASDAIGLDLIANIDTADEDYVITLNTIVDLSQGFSNISVLGDLKAQFLNEETEYAVDFVYQNSKAYLDMFNGKISVDTNNVIEPVMQIINILGVEMPEMSAMDMSGMSLNDILGLLSDLKEIKNDDGTITLDINIVMLNCSIQLICDKSYNIQEIIAPTINLDGMTITLDTNLTYPQNITFPTKNDEEYIETANLLNIVNGATNYFKNNELAFDFDFKYDNIPLKGKIFADVENKTTKIELNIEGQIVDLILVDEVIYIEYENVYAQFALSDFDQINEFLNSNFGIKIPLEKIKNMLTSVKNGEMPEIPGGTQINVKPSDIDLSILEKVYVEGNKTIIKIKDIGELAFTLQEDQLKAIGFKGNGATAQLFTVPFTPFKLKQEKPNYINLVNLIPTVDNALDIMKMPTLSGAVTVGKGNIELPINFKMTNEKDMFVEVWTEIEGYVIKLNYLDNKVYVDLAGKFKALVAIDDLSDQIIDFLSGLDITINMEGIEEMTSVFNDMVNSNANPLLIKKLEKTTGGFIITFFNNIEINLVNGAKTMAVSSSIEGFDVDVVLNGSNEDIIIPTFDDSEYNSTETIFELAKAFINSGMLDLTKAAINYFKDGYLGLDINVEYQGYVITGKLNVDILNMKVSLSLDYEDEKINLFMIDQVVYLEYRNVYGKFDLSDISQIDNLLNSNFGIDLPFEMVEKVLKIAKSENIDEAMSGVSDLIGDKFDNLTIDLSKIDLEFFDNITVKGNNTIIPISNNTITITVTDNVISKIAFNDILSADFVGFENKELSENIDSYINFADLIPTVENAIQIVKEDTISGTITVTKGEIEILVNYVVAKSENPYAEIWTEVEGQRISLHYYNGKAYLNGSDKLKLISVVADLPTAIENFINELNLELGEVDSKQMTDTLMGIVDVEKTPLLIKGLTQTENGFILTLFNDIQITLVNGSKTMTVSTSVEGFDIEVVINGTNETVTIPDFVDNEYNTVESVLDLIKAFVNSGMLDVTIGAANYFMNGNLGLNIDVEYEGYALTGNVYVDFANMKVALSINYQNETVNFFVIDKVVYLEYRNVFVKFALTDLDQVDALLNNNFGIDLPFEMVEKVLGITESKSIEDAMDQISSIVGDKADDFTIDLSKIDIDFFNNITVNENDTIIPVGDNTITVTVVDKVLTNIALSGIATANIGFVGYEERYLATDVSSYVDVADAIPTIESVIQIVKEDTISGTITVTKGEIEILVSYVIAKSGNPYAEIWTEVEGQRISLHYYNGKAYLNGADKLKLVSVVADLPTAIENFFNELNLELGEVDSKQMTDTLMGIVDVEKTPFLIKGLTQTENGFILTLFNDIQITLVNGSKTMTVSTSVEGFDIEVVINGSNETVTIPEFVDSEYNTVESVLDLIKAFVNSGMLDVTIGAANYFMNGNMGLNIDVNYNGYEFAGTLYADVTTMNVYLYATYDGQSINVHVIDKVAYIEFGNVYFKYAISDLHLIDELCNNYFGIDLPIEIVNEVVKLTECKNAKEVVNQLTSIIDDINEITGNEIAMPSEDFTLDVSKIDVDFFNKITRNGNNVIIPVGDNTITVTVIEKMLNKLTFAGLFNASIEFVDFKECGLTVDESNYINLADAIPTIESVIEIIQSPTITGELTIVDGEQTYPIDFVISKDGDYAEFKTVINQANLSVQYHNGFVYICFADHINLICELEKLPDAINTLTADTGSDTNISIEEQNVYISMIYDIIDPTLHQFLFTDYTKLENGFILSLFNGVVVTVGTSNSRIDVETEVNGISISGYITGNDTVISVPNFDNSQYIPIENIFKFVNAIKNMSKEKDFHIAGNIDIDGDLIGIGIDWTVPFDIKIKIVNGKLEMAATIGPIPTMVGVNNDVPYKADDTGSGSNRTLSIYLKDNDIYIYRTEKVPQFFGGGRTYEKCTKTTVEGFLSNPMYYLQYGLGFTDSIMGAIDDAIQKSANRANPINLNNVIKGFTVDGTGDNLVIVLNMAEIANNELMGDMTLNLSLGKNYAGEDIIANAGLSIYMPLAEGIFTLTLTSNDIHFVDYGKEVDMNDLYNYVNNYKYKYEEEWEASDGNWERSSLVQYTITFEENGGNEVTNITAVYNSPIMLPTLSPIIIDNGLAHVTKTFVGWYTTATFDKGTQFAATTMPRKDLTLYAAWSEEVRYYRTLSFVTNSNETVSNITAIEGSNITVPSLGIKVETDGITTTTYTFDGWYLDKSFTNAYSSYIMPSQDTTLYAKWMVADVETAKLLQIYDNNDVIFTRYILAGERIDLSGVAKYTEGSTQLYYDAGYATIYDYSFTMPDSDLNLYVRNQYTFILNTNKSGSVVEISRTTLWQNEAISLTTPQNSYTDDGTQTARVYYYFNGYTVNGVAGTAPSVMTNYDLTLCQTWTNETKLYYTIEFDLRWYLVFGCTEGSEMKTKPTPINPIKVLDGTTVDLSGYRPTCMAYETAVKSLFGKDLAVKYITTSWGTSAWANYTKAGSGFNSITITKDTGNVTLYACWKEA